MSRIFGIFITERKPILEDKAAKISLQVLSLTFNITMLIF